MWNQENVNKNHCREKKNHHDKRRRLMACVCGEAKEQRVYSTLKLKQP